jgi:hypothetical protein
VAGFARDSPQFAETRDVDDRIPQYAIAKRWKEIRSTRQNPDITGGQQSYGFVERSGSGVWIWCAGQRLIPRPEVLVPLGFKMFAICIAITPNCTAIQRASKRASGHSQHHCKQLFPHK